LNTNKTKPKPLSERELIAPKGLFRAVYYVITNLDKGTGYYYLTGDYSDYREANSCARANASSPYTGICIFDDSGVDVLYVCENRPSGFATHSKIEASL
jgi:hypothetical protein